MSVRSGLSFNCQPLFDYHYNSSEIKSLYQYSLLLSKNTFKMSSNDGTNGSGQQTAVKGGTGSTPTPANNVGTQSRRVRFIS